MRQLSDLINSLHEASLGLNSPAQNGDMLEALIVEGDLHQNSRWASHMTPSIDSPALLGQLLAGYHNGNLLSSELYPQLAAIEAQLIQWFCQLFGQHEGHFTHGSSYANLEALWQARDKSQNSSNIVYGSEATHYSIIKACHILGLRFQAIATNSLGQINTAKLHQACQSLAPIAIIATAGTTSSGAIDPLARCIEIADEFSSWCHIDAAWGGALILLPAQQELLRIGDADSVCFDPHKAWGQPKPSSILLYQSPLNTITDIDYLIQPVKQTLAGSYGGELFLPLWCSLLNGEDTLLNQLKLRLKQAEEFYHSLSQQSAWQVFYSPTGIICFKPPKETNLTHLEQQGMLSRSKINGESVWRIVFANHTTRSDDLLASLSPYF